MPCCCPQREREQYDSSTTEISAHSYGEQQPEEGVAYDAQLKPKTEGETAPASSENVVIADCDEDDEVVEFLALVLLTSPGRRTMPRA